MPATAKFTFALFAADSAPGVVVELVPPAPVADGAITPVTMMSYIESDCTS